MAAPTYVNKSAFASGVAGLTVGAVPNVVADDLILLFCESSAQAVTTPSGYTIAPSSPQQYVVEAGIGVRLSIFYRWATGADSTTTVADSGNHTCAIKMAYRGVDKTSPFNANAGSATIGGTTSVVLPSVTTTVADCLIVLAAATDRDAASTNEIPALTNANLSSITERHDESVTAGNGGGLVISDGVKATAGATGTSTVTASFTSSRAYITLALAPVIINVIADPGTYTFTGTAANTLFNRKVAADQGSFALAGSDATFSIGAAPNNYSITADSAAFALTGTAANLIDNRVLGADTVSFALTGQDAGLARGYVMPADALSCVLSGTDAGLRVNRVIVAASGSFNESMADAGLLYGRTVTADSVSFTLTGTDAALVKASPGSFTLTADGATYSLVGSNAAQLYGRNLGADATSFALTGTDATLSKFSPTGFTLTADPSAYALVGTDATLSKSGPNSYTLSVDSGSFALAGSDAILRASGDQATVVRGRLRFDDAKAEWEARQEFRKQAAQIIERLDEAPQEAPVTVETVAEVAPRFSLVEAMSEGVELGLDIDPILLALQARNAMQAEQTAMVLLAAIEQEREAIALAWFMAEAA